MVDDDQSDYPEEDGPPHPREVWAVLITGVQQDKVRPAVVMEHHGDRTMVVYGGGTPHPTGHHAKVRGGTRRAEDMGLVKDTYFRHTAVAFVEADAFKKYLGECPSALAIKLAQLAFDFINRHPPKDDAE